MQRGFGGIGLELIGKCSASCKFCSLGYTKEMVYDNVITEEKIAKDTGKISYDLVDEIVEEHPLNLIIFTGLSEPFLAPDRMMYIAEKGIHHGFGVYSYTNGSSVNADILGDLLAMPNFKGLHFSLNAVTDDTRKRVMGLSLEKAEENLKMYLKMRKQFGREHDTSVGVVMMLTPENKFEQKAFRRKWTEEFSKFENCPEPGVFNSGNWGGEVEDYWMSCEGRIRKCAQWDSMSPTISSDGYIYLCCYSSRYVFGHVNDQEAVDKWFNRKEIFKITDNVRNYPYFCQDCNSIYEENRWRR